MRWMISNVMIETDASGNYRPSKKKSSEKIDFAVAAIMALAASTRKRNSFRFSTLQGTGPLAIQ